MTTMILERQFPTREAFLAQAKADNVAFLEANKGRVLIEYVREPAYEFHSMLASGVRRGSPNAVLVAYKTDDGNIQIGWSAAKQPSQFNKTEGLWRAVRRATGQGRPPRNVPRRLQHGHHSSSGVGVDRQVTINTFMARAAVELDR